MKRKLKKAVGLTLIATSILVFSCKKNDATINTPQETITAAKKQNIAKKEVTKFSYTKATNGQSIAWTVTPSKDVFMTVSGTDAYFKFNRSGTYKVYARRGNATDSTSVNVNDSTANPKDTTFPGGGGGSPIDTTINPVDSSNWCSASFGMDLFSEANETYVTAFSTTDSGRVVKGVDLSAIVVLSNGCQRFERFNIYDSTATHHYVTLKGIELTCPNIVCTQAITKQPSYQRTFTSVLGLHTYYYYKNGQLLFTKSVTVN